MDNQQLNRVSETLNTEMDIRESTDEAHYPPQGRENWQQRAARGAEGGGSRTPPGRERCQQSRQG